MKILFFAAAGDPDRALAIGAEHDAIVAAVRASQNGGRFQIIPRLAGRLSDLNQALLEEQPDILHFACHGSENAELLLTDDRGAAVAVPPRRYPRSCVYWATTSRW